jgi:hypothetical protein
VNRCTTVILASTIVLLGSSTPVALSRDAYPSSVQRPTSAMAAVGAYFAMISSGWRTGNFSRLADVVAPHATLTRTDAHGHTAAYGGLTAIARYYLDARERGMLPEVGIVGIRYLSASVLIAYTEAGGAGSTIVSRSVQVLVVKNDMIVGCDWVVLSSVQQG